MAFIRINQIKDADGSIEPDELELANDIIEAMMITRKGSIPGSRGYGLTQIFIDMPGPDAINMITVELAEAMDEYIPGLELQPEPCRESRMRTATETCTQPWTTLRRSSTNKRTF